MKKLRSLLTGDTTSNTNLSSQPNKIFERNLLRCSFSKSHYQEQQQNDPNDNTIEYMDLSTDNKYLVQAYQSVIYVYELLETKQSNDQNFNMKCIFTHNAFGQQIKCIKFVNQKYIQNYLNGQSNNIHDSNINGNINNGQYLVYGTTKGNVVVLDYINGLGIINLDCKQSVTCLLIHPVYPYLLVGGKNGKIVIWNLNNLKIEKELRNNTSILDTYNDHITSMTINQYNSNIVATSSKDGIVRVFNIPFHKLSKNPKVTSTMQFFSSSIEQIDYYRGFNENMKDYLLVPCRNGNTFIVDKDKNFFLEYYAKENKEAISCSFQDNMFIILTKFEKYHIVLFTADKSKLRAYRPYDLTENIAQSMITDNMFNRTKLFLGHDNSITSCTTITKYFETPILPILYRCNNFQDVDIITSSYALIIKGSLEYYQNILKTDPDDAQAQYEIGNMLMNGLDVNQNEYEGLQWLLKSANNNNAQAQYQSGMYYLNFCNNSLARKWLFESSKNGNALAQYQLSRLYDEGLIVEKNSIESFNWALKSAKQLYEPAIKYIINCYKCGIGVETNEAHYRIWNETLTNIGIKVQRFTDIFNTFATEDHEDLENIEDYSFSRPTLVVKVYAEKFYINASILKRCEYLKKLLPTPTQKQNESSITVLDITSSIEQMNDEIVKREESYTYPIESCLIGETTVKYYLQFLQYSTIPKISKEDHYKVLTSLFDLSTICNNESCSSQVLKLSNPIQRCYLLHTWGLLTPLAEFILSYFIVVHEDNLRQSNLPENIIYFLKSSKNHIISIKGPSFNLRKDTDDDLSNITEERKAVIETNIRLDKELESLVDRNIELNFFRTNIYERFEKIPKFFTIEKAENGYVIIRNALKNFKLLIEFIGIEKIAYYIEFKDEIVTVILSPLIEYFEIRGIRLKQ